MEGGTHGHGYLQDDINYDELMSNNTGWSGSGAASGDQYSFQPQTQPVQEPTYPRFANNQQAYGNYDGSQPAQSQYQESSTFSASPYSSHYQHARPSDVFGPTSYNLDPSLQSSAAPYQSSFSFAPQESATVAPHSLQYTAQSASSQPASRGSVNAAQYQQSLNNYNQRPQGQVAFYNASQNGSMQETVTSATYPVLQNGVPSRQSMSLSTANAISSNDTLAQATPLQNPLRVTHPQLLLVNNTSTRPSFEFAPYMRWSDDPVSVAPGLKSTVPKYRPRKSKSGKELVPGFDVSRVSAPPRASTKKIRAPKEPNSSVSKYKGTSQGSKQAPGRLANLRDQGSGVTVKSPSTPTETSSSSSEEESSSEESEYEEEEEMPPVKELHEIRGKIRPTDPVAAARFDAIGIVWTDEHMSPSLEVIKSAIDKYGDLVTEIRVRLKDYATKIAEASARPGELSQLKKARATQLEALYEVINVANELGHSHIVENLGTHQKLVLGLTTTLIEFNKTKDYAGKIPKAIFTLLAKFRTLTDELLTKLKFEKIGSAFTKNTKDEQIKKDIAFVIANTTDSRTKAEKAKQDGTKSEDQKKTLEAIDKNKARKVEQLKATTSSAKRPHDGDINGTKPSKKFASDVAGAPVSTTKPIPKRATLSNNLLGITAKPIAKPAPKPLAKRKEPSPPPVSKLGAILDSINEAPKPAKIPAAPAQLKETAEQKAKRERKESRRHLRVKFKEGSELAEIRLFKHEQAEDEGRLDDMLRDAHDDRSEGMMHKKRVSRISEDTMMDDDEGPSDSFDERPYPANLLPVDLSNVEKATVFGPTYVTRGGGKTFATPEQQTQRQREELELMVVYTDPRDIPSTPKEPAQAVSGEVNPERELKGPTAPWVTRRLQEIQQYGPEVAAQIFISERKGQAIPARATFAPQPSNFNSLLQHLGGPQQSQPHLTPQTQQNPTATMDPDAFENLRRVVETLTGKPYPPTQPPDWMKDPARISEWWEGYNRDKAAKEQQTAHFAQQPAANFQQPPMLPHLATPQIQGQLPYQMPAGVPQYPPHQAPQPQPPMVTAMSEEDVTAQVQAYLGMSTGQAAQDSSHQQYDHNNWSGGNGRNQDYQNGEQWDSKRGKGKQAPKKKWGGFGGDGPAPFDENGEYKGKKKPCVFWAKGKCAKGAKCTFLHDESE